MLQASVQDDHSTRFDRSYGILLLSGRRVTSQCCEFLANGFNVRFISPSLGVLSANTGDENVARCDLWILHTRGWRGGAGRLSDELRVQKATRLSRWELYSGERDHLRYWLSGYVVRGIRIELENPGLG